MSAISAIVDVFIQIALLPATTFIAKEQLEPLSTKDHEYKVHIFQLIYV
jgi:hypothetical protein